MSGGAPRAAEGTVDSGGIRRTTSAAPERLAAAFAAASDAASEAGARLAVRPIEAVVVLGEGEASLAASAFVALSAPLAGVPVLTAGAGELPGFTGPGTLVLACPAGSGDPETLGAAESALGRGARLAVVSGAGALDALGAGEGIPVVAAGGPGGPGAERAAGFLELLATLLALAGELGVVPGTSEMVAAAIAQLERRRESLAVPGGLDTELARRIGRTIPLVHGASGIGWVAARRWKSLVNAWAKAPAFAASQPAASYDEVCGFGQNGDVTRQILTLVVLRSGHEPARSGTRFAAFAELTREALAGIVELRAEGHGPLAQLLDLTLVGELVALRLAAHEEIDPGPTPAADEVAARVATASGAGSAPR